MNSRLVLFLFALLITSCSMFTDPENEGMITGVVKDKITNQNVASLKIYLINISVPPDSNHLEDIRNKFVDSTYTDSDGMFAFEGISAGTYTAVPNVFRRHEDLIVYLDGNTQTAKLDVNNNRQEINYLIEDNQNTDGDNNETTQINIKVLGVETRNFQKIVLKQKGWLADIPWMMYNVKVFEASELVGGWMIKTNVTNAYEKGMFRYENYYQFEVHTLAQMSGALGESQKVFMVNLSQNDNDTLYWKYYYPNNTVWSVTKEEYFGSN